MQKFSSVPRDYLIGLNFLLAEEPDKAVDIFIKMLEVDSDTVETHLALGHLFRRRGEVDRAIRIHQNLIARPHLDSALRQQALLALGQDYMRAGVLDRAERIFLEVNETGSPFSESSLRLLLEVYQQEKAWDQAITTARKIEAQTQHPMHANIAHYYCELGQEALANADPKLAKSLYHRALGMDKKCVRASLGLGALAMEKEDYRTALDFYREVKNQDPDYLSESIAPLVNCYKQCNHEQALIDYLKQCLQEFPRITVVLVLAELLQKHHGVQAAMDCIAEYLRNNPSIRGLQRLIELQLQDEQQKNLQILWDLTKAMLVNKPIYRCLECGFNGKSLHWLCPRCKNWNTVKPIHGLDGD